MDRIILYLKNSNAVERVIMLCLLLFIPCLLWPQFIVRWFALPADLSEIIGKAWSIITYAFVHLRFLHLLSNLLILYYFGSLFLDFFSSSKFYVYYMTGILVGSLFFVAINQIITTSNSFPLIGGSAAVTAIMIGIAAKVPHYAIHFRFIGRIEIWILALIWIFLSVIGTSGVDAGAAAAHLGGGLSGYLLTVFFGEVKFINHLVNKIKGPKNTFKKVYRQQVVNVKPSFRNKKENQKQIDMILDKISKSGYNTLTKEEKDFLFNQK